MNKVTSALAIMFLAVSLKINELAGGGNES